MFPALFTISATEVKAGPMWSFTSSGASDEDALATDLVSEVEPGESILENSFSSEEAGECTEGEPG